MLLWPVGDLSLRAADVAQDVHSLETAATVGGGVWALPCGPWAAGGDPAVTPPGTHPAEAGLQRVHGFQREEPRPAAPGGPSSP